jgi:hypothetical protein
MKTIWGILALVVTIIVAPPTKGEFTPISDTYIWGPDVRWLKLDKNTEFSVTISDQVSGGCWTNIKAVKTAVELELKRSGYNLAVEGPEFSTKIFMTSLGYEMGEQYCVATYSMKVLGGAIGYFNESGHSVKSAVNAWLWTSDGILSVGKSEMNSRLKNAYVEMIQSFLIIIDAKKKAALKAVKATARISPEAKDFWSNYKLD